MSEVSLLRVVPIWTATAPAPAIHKNRKSIRLLTFYIQIVQTLNNCIEILKKKKQKEKQKQKTKKKTNKKQKQTKMQMTGIFFLLLLQVFIEV